MKSKDQLRKKFYTLRKKKYFEVSSSYFSPLLSLLNNTLKKKPIYLSSYYPSNYEVDTLKIFELIKSKKNITSLLPSVSSKNMKFYKWRPLDSLSVNKYGMLDPSETKNNIIPNVVLVPLLAFDKNNHRLGYGKGYYDKFSNKYLNTNKNILTIGVAFSFQKYNKLPTSNFDFKLNYILTENGLN